MKYFQHIITVFLVLASHQLMAQDTVLHLSLEKAREIAISNHPDIKVKETDVLIAEDNIALEKIRKYPTVFGDFNLQRNLIIPVTPVPAKAFDPSAPDDEIRPLQFTTKWTGNTGLNASFDVFNPNSKGELKIKKAEAEIARTDREIAENEVYYSTGKAYLAALIAQEQLLLNTAEVTSKIKTLEMLTSQYGEGRITRTELNEGKSDINLAQTRETEAKNIAEKANAQLLYELGYNPEIQREIVFEDRIEALFTNQSTLEHKETESLSLRKLEQQREVLQYKLDQEQIRNLPTISLGGYYGINYFDNDFDPFKDKNLHGNSYVKIGVTVPLTDWLTQGKNKRIVRHQYEANELTYQNQQHKLALNRFSNQKDVESAYEKYIKLKENFELAQNNQLLTQQRFEEGRILINELFNADFAVQKAQNDYLNALYDYLNAQLELENEQRK